MQYSFYEQTLTIEDINLKNLCISSVSISDIVLVAPAFSVLDDWPVRKYFSIFYTSSLSQTGSLDEIQLIRSYSLLMPLRPVIKCLTGLTNRSSILELIVKLFHLLSSVLTFFLNILFCSMR